MTSAIFQLHCNNRSNGHLDDDEAVAREECAAHDGEICFGEIEHCQANHSDDAGWMEKLYFLHSLTEGGQEARCLVIMRSCKNMAAYYYVGPNQERNYELTLAKVKVGPYGMAHTTLEHHYSNYFLDGGRG